MTRRVDESMTLINEMMQRPLDPSYAAAAQRRRADGHSGTPSWRSPWVIVITVLTGALMAVAVVNIGALARPGERAASRAELITRIGQGQDAIAARSAQVTRLQDDVHNLAGSALGDAQARRLRDLTVQAGATAVAGPGLRITLDDSADTDAAPGIEPRGSADDTSGRVVARDLVYLTNALWQAGAEAISVNEHRLTSVTAIRAAGPAITVGFRPLSRPYVIEAIAGPAAATQFQTGLGAQYLDELRDSYQVAATAKPVPDLTLSATEVLTLRHAYVPSSNATTSSRPVISSPTATREPSR